MILGWSNTTRLKFECWTHGTICGPEPARGTTLMLLRNGWPRGGANGTKALRYNMHSRGKPSARKRSLKCALPLRSLCQGDWLQRKPAAWWKHRSWRMQGAKYKRGQSVGTIPALSSRKVQSCLIRTTQTSLLFLLFLGH